MLGRIKVNACFILLPAHFFCVSVVGVFFCTYNAMMFTGRIILASRSPRRAQLLAEAGYRWVQVDPPFADPPQPPRQLADRQHIIELACELARCKAQSLLHSDGFAPQAGDVLISADTIVIAGDGELLGQPENADDAERMLKLLLGRTHQVVTGVAMVCFDRGATTISTALPSTSRVSPSSTSPLIEPFADVAKVTMGATTPTWLQQYIQAGHWHGKAGGYNLTELSDIEIKVEGDPTTVVGLPMQQIIARLSTLP